MLINTVHNSIFLPIVYVTVRPWKIWYLYLMISQLTVFSSSHLKVTYMYLLSLFLWEFEFCGPVLIVNSSLKYPKVYENMRGKIIKWMNKLTCAIFGFYVAMTSIPREKCPNTEIFLVRIFSDLTLFTQCSSVGNFKIWAVVFQVIQVFMNLLCEEDLTIKGIR